MNYSNKDYIEHASTRPVRGCNLAAWKMSFPCRPVLWERWNVSTTLGKSM